MPTTGLFSQHYNIAPLNANIRIFVKGDLKTTSGPNSVTTLGSGCFGQCTLYYLSQVRISAKSLFADEYSHFIHECNIISTFCHPNVVFLLGICQKPRLILTIFHGIEENKSLTLHSAIYSRKHAEDDRKGHVENWTIIMSQLISGLIHIHSKEILHNDLKCDNVVLGYSAGANELTPVIIDFGKSCFGSQGKKYTLNAKQIALYKEKHPQIAPDLREGYCKQSTASDVYSLARIFNIIIKEYSGFGTILQTTIVHSSLSFHAAERPKLIDIEKAFK